MKISQSIQRKVFIIFGSFTLLMALLYSLMNVLIAYVIEDEILEKILAHEGKVIEQTYQKEGRVSQPQASYMKLYLEPNQAPKEVALAYQNKTLTSEVFAENNEVHYHIQYLYFNSEQPALLVSEVTPFLSVSNASNRILLLFVIVLVAVLLLSLWLAYKVAAKTTKPIAVLAQEVMKQQSKTTAASFSAEKTPDEIGYLAYVIRSAINQLQQLVQRESDFNRDLSHELRTPLTVLNNTLSLADTRTLSKADLDVLGSSVQQMNQTVSSLLAMARAESLEYESIGLRALLEDCILLQHSKLADDKFEVNLQIEDDCRLFTNKQILILLVNNLLQNAMRYSSSNNLVIRLENQLLYFENEIASGITKSDITKLTDDRVKQDDSIGIGQGLYLVKRIIESLGWGYSLSSHGLRFQFIIHLDTNKTDI